MATPSAILEFWFGQNLQTIEGVTERNALWFGTSESFDQEIRDRFGEHPDRARQGQFDAWKQDAYSCLALVLVLDQFPRNLYRDSPRGFAYDAAAYAVATEAIDSGFDTELGPFEATFLYLPLEHAESAEVQARCVSLFSALLERAPARFRPQFETYLDYARRHQDIINRFGRFPHRNAVLRRESSDAERSFLDSGGDTFGSDES